MNARARALSPTLYPAEHSPIFRYWAPGLLALCLGSWLGVIAAGQYVIEHL